MGVTGCDGSFSAGDAVEVFGGGEQLIAKGVATMDVGSLTSVMGRRTSELAEGESTVIHRDNLVVLAP